HYTQLYGLDIIALRFGSVWGPGKFGVLEAVNPMIELLEAAMAGRPFKIAAGADQRADLCYTAECANGVLAALDSPARARPVPALQHRLGRAHFPRGNDRHRRGPVPRLERRSGAGTRLPPVRPRRLFQDGHR